MSEQNKAVIRRFYEAVNKKDVAIFEQVCDPKFVNHTPGPGDTTGGLAGLRQMFSSFQPAFPDLRFNLHQIVAEGDTVIAHFTADGTHKGAFMGAAPTGKKIAFHGADIWKVRNGKAAEVWHYGDEAMAMAEIGVKPPR